MGKRSDFERIPRDYYPTPYEAVLPLVPHLPQKPFSYAEPCAGDGRLISHLAKHGGEVRYAYDIEPRSDWVKEADALTQGYTQCEYIITNPPWNRKILHPMIEHFADFKPTWLLFDADWMHTKQSTPYLLPGHFYQNAGRAGPTFKSKFKFCLFSKIIIFKK